MRISIGVIIAIILIFFWYRHDHPDAVATPGKVGAGYTVSNSRAA